ncbi:MAG: hypothetical protein ACLFPX_02145 [Candidatus Omnitrophota bacterium]
MRYFKISAAVLFPLILGCASAVQRDSRLATEKGSLLNTSETEDLGEAAAALKSVAGSLTEKEMTNEEAREAVQRLKNDEEAQSAVRAISTSFDHEVSNVKYSPVTGKRYSGDLEYDPETGVKLLPVE